MGGASLQLVIEANRAFFRRAAAAANQKRRRQRYVHSKRHSRWYDCEDRGRSLMVVGCGLVTASVTPGMTGESALLRPVRSWLPAPARLEELA